jgi:hypothetical protein
MQDRWIIYNHSFFIPRILFFAAQIIFYHIPHLNFSVVVQRMSSTTPLGNGASKRSRHSSERELNPLAWTCGSLWFDHLPDNTSFRTVQEAISLGTQNAVPKEEISLKFRSRRGGILVTFNPPERSLIVGQCYEQVASRIPGVVIKPPASVQLGTDCSIVVLGISYAYLEDDILDHLIPKPIEVHRLYGKDGKPLDQIKAVYQTPQEADAALASKPRFLSEVKKAYKWIKPAKVFCRRCKVFGPQHENCDIRCAKCGDSSHFSKQCTAEVLSCPRCSGDHSLYKCPQLSEEKQKASKQRHLRTSQTKAGVSYARAVGSEGSPTGLDAPVVSGDLLAHITGHIVGHVLDALFATLRSIPQLGGDVLDEKLKNTIKEQCIKEIATTLPPVSHQMAHKDKVRNTNKRPPKQSHISRAIAAKETEMVGVNSSQPSLAESFDAAVAQRNSDRVDQDEPMEEGQEVPRNHTLCPNCSNIFSSNVFSRQHAKCVRADLSALPKGQTTITDFC